jgi:FkbM family methyltransferase
MKAGSKSPFWRRALRSISLRTLHLAENNNDSDFVRNGEAWLLREIMHCHSATAAKSEGLVLFDVGANVGGYTRAALAEGKRAGCPLLVHVFEPSRNNNEILRDVFASYSNVHVTCAAVADLPGRAILYSEFPGSSQASLIRRATFQAQISQETEVPVIRLDTYMADHGIHRVNFLKMDVEGAELSALRGLGDKLNPDSVQLIQFEYGGTAMDAGVKLKDFYDLLSLRGYVVAKLFPRALEVRSYKSWMENYAYANYVAASPEFLGT